MGGGGGGVGHDGVSVQSRLVTSEEAGRGTGLGGGGKGGYYGSLT